MWMELYGEFIRSLSILGGTVQATSWAASHLACCMPVGTLLCEVPTLGVLRGYGE